MNLPGLPKPIRLDLTRPFSLIWSSSANFNPTLRPLVVLDSSYNPPSRAHTALCLASLATQGPRAQLLLLLSTKNADSSKSSKEEAVLQRKIAMVHAMALDLVDARRKEQEADLDVSIALVGEPYFTQKNAILKQAWPEAALSWIIGWDTLLRFFDPKYYPEGVEAAVQPFFQANSQILWFSRPSQQSLDDTASEERQFLHQPQVQQFASGLQQIPVPPEALQVSSTRAREAVKSGNQQDLDVCVSPRVQEVVKREQLYLDA